MVSWRANKPWLLSLHVIAIWLLSVGLAQAANYIFPGNLPSGCSGSGGSYTCGSLTLGYGDTITIATPKPATITVNGNMSTNTSRINAGGAASDLTLVVKGELKAEYQAEIQANVTAGSVKDSSGSVTFGGSLSVTTGKIELNYLTSVAGAITSTSGDIKIGQNNVVGGNITSTSGDIEVGYAARINGDVATSGAMILAQSSTVAGKITGSSGSVAVGYAATVSGTITTSSGAISLAQNSVVSSCVRSTDSASITLGYQSTVNSVCCGSNCGTSCVVNNSTYSMPPKCSGSSTSAASLSYFPIPISPLNEDITVWSNGSAYAGLFTGKKNLAGVPFDLKTDADGDNVFWGTNLNISNFSGSSSLTLTLATNLYGATEVFTLINSAWGTAGKNVGSITFKASNGDSYTVQLVEGVNVRDHYYGSYVNTVSSSAVTLNVVGSNKAGTAHLDMQTFKLPSSFATETLTSISFTSTGSSATGLPFLAGVTVKAASQGSTTTVIPKSFNCVESAQNALGGRLYTKLAGTPFAFDVVALKDGNSDGVADAVETSYASDKNRSVTLELVDASSGASCSALPAISPPIAQTLIFTQAGQAAEQGRKSSSAMTLAKAYPNLRCRVTDASQVSPVVGCSTDNFAVRPTDFSISSSADASSIVKAGANFSLNAATGIAGYNGTPKLDDSKVSAHTGAVATGTLNGAFGAADAATGTAAGNTFSYSEVGLFNLAAQGVYDDQFAAVDVAAGDCSNDFSNSSVGGVYGCKFGNSAATANFGRFIPDHFDVSLNNPVFAPACGNFTYVGQPVKYSTVPVADVTARNTAGVTTRNYTGGYWKIDPTQIAPAYSEASQPLTVLNAGAPAVVDNGSGSGTLSFANTTSNIFNVTRGNPIAPFNAEIAMSFSLIDADGVQVANINGAAGSNPVKFGAASAGGGIAFSGANKQQRWGRLVLGNSHGSELKNLSVPLFSEYFNGAAFVANSLDNCTTLNLSSQITLTNPATASGVVQNGNVAMTIGSGNSKATLLNSPLAAGDAGLSFTAPGAGNTGYIDIKGDFAEQPWLLFDWDHNGTHDNSPASRASFGLYKGNSQQIYLRELY